MWYYYHNKTYILIECADLVEVKKKYFEERSLYSLFWNVNLERILISLEKLVYSTKYEEVIFVWSLLTEGCILFVWNV